MGTYKSWSHLTAEMLEDAHERLGTWKAVADHLGMERTGIARIRKNLGMKMLDFPDHDRRAWRGSRLDPIREKIVEMARSGLNCSQIAEEIGETDPEIVRDYLSKLGVARQRVGPPEGERNSSWNGGKTIDKDGYLLVQAPKGHPGANSNGYIRYHRLLMEQTLGRYLLPEEVVHHIDGNKKNNDPDNLELFAHNGLHLQKEWSDPKWAEHQSRVRRRVHQGLRIHQE